MKHLSAEEKNAKEKDGRVTRASEQPLRDQAAHTSCLSTKTIVICVGVAAAVAATVYLKNLINGVSEAAQFLSGANYISNLPH